MLDLARQLLLHENRLDPRQVRQAEDLALRERCDFCSACWALKLLTEQKIADALARAHGFPGIDLSRSAFPVANLELVSPELISERVLLPVVVTAHGLVVAFADPDDRAAIDQVRLVTGRRVLPHVAVDRSLRQAVSRALQARGKGLTMVYGEAFGNATIPAGGFAAVVGPTMLAHKLASSVGEAPVPSPRAADPAWRTSPTAARPRPVRDVAPVPAGVSGAATIKGGVGTGKVVLVVDDEDGLRAMVKKALEPLGSALMEAGDGKAALDAARDGRPDVVVLDALLPLLNGFEVCRAIKGDPELASCRILLMSGKVPSSRAFRGDVLASFGASGFLEKPFKVNDLVAEVRGLLLQQGEEPAQAARRAAAEALCRDAANLLAQGMVERSIVMLQDAAEKAPLLAAAHYYLGEALLVAGKPYESLAAWERASELRPDMPAPLTRLAVLYDQLGFKKSARDTWLRALECTAEPALREVIQQHLRA